MVATAPAIYSPADMTRRTAYNSEDPVPGSLGDFVRRRRLELGMSQQALADRMADFGAKGDQSDISKLEVPGTKLPRPDRMEKLAAALSISLSRLYMEAGYPGHAGIGVLGEDQSPIILELFRELHELEEDELTILRRDVRTLWEARRAGRKQKPISLEERRRESEE